MNQPDLTEFPGLPKDDGGPVFAEPWQAQAFAMAVKLSHAGYFTWKEWAAELAVELKQEILPIVLCDTNCAMPRDAYWFEPFHTTVRALPPNASRGAYGESLGSALARELTSCVFAKSSLST